MAIVKKRLYNWLMKFKKGIRYQYNIEGVTKDPITITSDELKYSHKTKHFLVCSNQTGNSCKQIILGDQVTTDNYKTSIIFLDNDI